MVAAVNLAKFVIVLPLFSKEGIGEITWLRTKACPLLLIPLHLPLLKGEKEENLKKSLKGKKQYEGLLPLTDFTE